MYLQTSTYELIELRSGVQRAMTSTHSVTCDRYQLKRCDDQLLSPATDAAADTSPMQLNGELGKRQSEIELIKKAKHNRGIITFRHTVEKFSYVLF